MSKFVKKDFEIFKNRWILPASSLPLSNLFIRHLNNNKRHRKKRRDAHELVMKINFCLVPLKSANKKYRARDEKATTTLTCDLFRKSVIARKLICCLLYGEACEWFRLLNEGNLARIISFSAFFDNDCLTFWLISTWFKTFLTLLAIPHGRTSIAK